MPKLLNWFTENDLKNDPGVRKVLEGYAQRAKPVAQSLAQATADAGAFGASIDVDGTRLFSDDPGALSIEFGTSDTEPQAVLRRAAEAVGGKLSGG